MFTAGKDDVVSNIHRRWSFTKINPSSYKQSFAISLVSAAIIEIFSHIFYLHSTVEILALCFPLGLAAFAGSYKLDQLALRGTPVNKLSKIAHVSAFANALWALTILLGLAAELLFSKQSHDNYIIAGMLLAVGLRIGIFTSVFGARIDRAIAVSFIQPIIFLLAFLGPSVQTNNNSFILNSYFGFIFGFTFVALGTIWSVIADRAGRPNVKSTFDLLQAFLAAWTENKVDQMEQYMEERAHDGVIFTRILRFLNDSSSGGNGSGSNITSPNNTATTTTTTTAAAAVVLPDIHPGPFSRVGGSNLPYVMYDAFSKRALIMHSISDHSLNIPSKGEVEKYITDLGNRSKIVEKGKTCSIPVHTRINNAKSAGIAFGNTALITLSLAPAGMEDVPLAMRTELESYGTGLGFSNVLVIDSHNAMGGQLGDLDRADLLKCAMQCLDKLKKSPQQAFTIGFSSLKDISFKLKDSSGELGEAGLAILVLGIDGKNYAIAWADSNNMENNLRDYIISKVNGLKILEICTSDTHSTSGKRTREGYFALGTASNHDDIVRAYEEMAYKAAEDAVRSSFIFAISQSMIKVMGNKQFEDYSLALDKSMRITKFFLGITVATYIAMLILS